MPPLLPGAKTWSVIAIGFTVLMSAPGYGQASRQELVVQAPDAALAAAQSATTQEDYNEAVYDFVAAMQRQYPTVYWKEPFMMGSFQIYISSPAKDKSLWDPAFFDAYIPASSVRQKALRTYVKTAGQGVPFVGVRQATTARMSADPFLPEAGMVCPVTILLEFTKPLQPGAAVDVHLKVVNPKRSHATLAADYSAPLELLMAHARPDHFILQGLLRPLESQGITGLFMVEPYQNGKIPVVMIHGLDSSPRTWLNTYNELMADPVIRERYQFWFFRYPTGNPVVLSAARLRGALQQVRAYNDPGQNDKSFDNMVVLGHSMGGMLTRLLVTESSDAFWRSNSNIRFEDANLPPGDREVLQETLFFHPQPFVKRVVFISTPHRGSDLASGSVAKMATKMINMPLRVTGISERRTDQHPDGMSDQHSSVKVATGIDNLKPTNPLVQSLQLQPIYAPYHSIIGNHGVTWHGVPYSDGVVPYTSSHLEGAQSEVVVPSNHSAHAHPLAVVELKRILRLHLTSTR